MVRTLRGLNSCYGLSLLAGKGMTELNYANIEADLGTFMHSILTQCANMEEVEVIQTLFLIIWSIIMAR